MENIRIQVCQCLPYTTAFEVLGVSNPGVCTPNNTLFALSGHASDKVSLHAYALWMWPRLCSRMHGTFKKWGTHKFPLGKRAVLKATKG